MVMFLSVCFYGHVCMVVYVRLFNCYNVFYFVCFYGHMFVWSFFMCVCLIATLYFINIYYCVSFLVHRGNDKVIMINSHTHTSEGVGVRMEGN
jgi:hypothetical protein